MMTALGRALGWLRVHGHHLVFAVSLLSLVALSGHWAIFFRGAVRRETYQRFESIRESVALHAAMLGHSPGGRPELGPLAADPRLEITPSPRPNDPHVRSLSPQWPDLHVQARAEAVKSLENRSSRRTLMVTGESALLVLLLLMSSVMLYRLVWAERRSTAEIQELWGRATHEIKTPIAGIKAFLETLRTQEISREETIRYADMALKQVNRQQQLAENILIGRRLNREDGRFNMSRVDLPDFLRAFLAAHDLLLVGAQVKLETAGPAPPLVHADPDVLRVIASNLVDNAAKYCRGPLELMIRIETRNRRVLLVFRDNGPGFEPRVAARLFDAYRHLAGGLPDADHGTGVGLHISRRLARRMGGDLEASSQGRGRGAEFRLTLRSAKGAR